VDQFGWVDRPVNVGLRGGVEARGEPIGDLRDEFRLDGPGELFLVCA
jgi:hypothetical protein